MSLSRLSLSFAFTLVLATGCEEPVADQVESRSQQLESPCADAGAEVCVDDQCTAEAEQLCLDGAIGSCYGDQDCPAGTRCTAGEETCLPPPGCLLDPDGGCPAVCTGTCVPEVNTCGPLVCPVGTHGCNCACNNAACVPDGMACAAVCM